MNGAALDRHITGNYGDDQFKGCVDEAEVPEACPTCGGATDEIGNYYSRTCYVTEWECENEHTGEVERPLTGDEAAELAAEERADAMRDEGGW